MKIFQYILLILFGLAIFSCQHEDNSAPKITTESLTINSPLTSLLSRVSQNPTAIDNILDGTSFCSVQLPVTVYVDYQKVVITSKADFVLVANLMAESIYDDDLIHFDYPITMMYRNFVQFQVTSDVQLKQIKESYGEYVDFQEIDCIDFDYPIVINTYNSNSQVAKTIPFQTNSQLFNFLANLKDTDIISMVFPISISTNSNNQTIIINNNTQLNTAIENVIDLCETPVGSNSNLQLSNVIINGTWHVSYYLDETEDETSEFYGYNFTFYSNGTVIASKNTTTIHGIWNYYTDLDVKKMNLNFDGTILEEINKDWKLLELNATNVRLTQSSGETHYLYFTKN